MGHFIVLPAIEQPKYIIPLNSSKVFNSSLNLYTPYILRRKLEVKILQKLGYTKLLPWILPNNIIGMEELHKIIPTCNKIFNWLYDFYRTTNINFAIHLGSSEKLTVQVMNNNGSIISYVKIGISLVAKQSIEHEYLILSDFAKKIFENILIPEILTYSVESGHIFLALKMPNSHCTASPLRFTTSHLKALTELFRVNIVFESFKQSGWFTQIHNALNSFENGVKINDYKKCLDFVADKLNNRILPFGFCHYDFKPWNIKITTDKRLYVFDWELARQNWLPLWDYFHFVLQVALLIKHQPVKNLINRLLKPDQFAISYMQEFNINPEFYPFFLMLYLIDVSLYNYKINCISEDKRAVYYVNEVHSLLSQLYQQFR